MPEPKFVERLAELTYASAAGTKLCVTDAPAATPGKVVLPTAPAASADTSANRTIATVNRRRTKARLTGKIRT